MTTEQLLTAYPALLQEAERYLRNQAVANGLVFISHGHLDDGSWLRIKPYTLSVLPARLPNDSHCFALNLQAHWLDIVHRVAMDDQFLERCLSPVAQVDEFVYNLMHIHRETQESTRTEQLHLCLMRTDYLLSDTSEMKLVEFNTMNALGSGRATRLQTVSDGLCARLGTLAKSHRVSIIAEGSRLAVTDANAMFASALMEAHLAYQERFREKRVGLHAEPVILCIVDDSSCVQFTQFSLMEIELEAPLVSRTIDEVRRESRLNKNQLLFVGAYEVSVIYFVSEAFDNNGNSLPAEHWETRLLLERSMAVKCPSACFQLAAMKSVQQALADIGVVEKFSKDAERIRRTFVGQYCLRDANVIQSAVEQPNRFVLKNNREGGGHNFFEIAVREKLLELKGTPAADAYVLMERIRPATQWNALCFGTSRPREVGQTINEYSYFGVTLTDGMGEVLHKQIARQLVTRTKMADSNEGGVMCGAGSSNTAVMV